MRACVQEKAAKAAKAEREAADVAAKVAAAEATPAGSKKDVSGEPPATYHPKCAHLRAAHRHMVVLVCTLQESDEGSLSQMLQFDKM